MAPTTRSKRAEEPATVATTGIVANTRGFPALPNELYLEIVSFLPACPIPHEEWVGEKPDPYRQLALYYLTQTCRSLRKFFLRYAWEQIEAFGGMWTSKGKLSDKKLANEILRQLETVTVRNPDLQKYVSTVNLTIPTYSQNAVVHEISRDLGLFPNLRTLQLIFQSKSSSHGEVFSNFRYPTIQTLNLNFRSPIEGILRSCPNIKHLSFYKDVCRWRSLGSLSEMECAGSIEKLGVVTHPSHRHILPGIVENLPHLRDISLYPETLKISNNLDFLSSLPLHTIRLRLDQILVPYTSPYTLPATSDERRTWIDSAMRTLAKCPQNEVAKKVIVVNDDKTVDTYNLMTSLPGSGPRPEE